MRAVFTPLLFSFLLFLPAFASAGSVQDSFEEDDAFSWEGYRLFRYKAPTPLTHEDAQVLTTTQVQQLLIRAPNTALIDVQPITWNQGYFIEKEPRQHIPGSIWIPNVGYGELNERWENYYRKYLKQLSSGNKNHPLVIYCTADCWMSWNAVKRAAEWGYTQLYWYRDGSDGWIEAELSTALAKPEPLHKE